MSFSTPQVQGLQVKDEGVTVANPANSMDFAGAGVAATATGGNVTVTISGGGGGSATDVRNEVPTDNADGTYTLAHTPVVGSVAVYKNGSRLKVGAGNDYTISGGVITLLITYESDAQITVDYQY